MTKNACVFYYSRRKLGLYLLFNLGLLALAILFTWSIFPDYKPVYYFALITCILSILSSLFVFLVRLPLAVINDESIKIDRNQALKWSQIKSIENVTLNCLGFERPILRILPQKINGYHMSVMQKISCNSRFGSFSIPLYAMENYQAVKIEKLIREHLSEQKPSPSAVSTKKRSFRNKAEKPKTQKKAAPKAVKKVKKVHKAKN